MAHDSSSVTSPEELTILITELLPIYNRDPHLHDLVASRFITNGQLRLNTITVRWEIVPSLEIKYPFLAFVAG